MRIGIFGASFDPPHIGHFIAAECAAYELGLSKVLLIPANLNPLKREHCPAAPEIRLRMTQAAVSGNALFEVSAIELERGGISYMAETVDALREEHPLDEFILLLGADSAAEFHLWYDYERLAEEVSLVIFNRPGYDLSLISQAMKPSHRTVKIPSIEISSTDIRSRIKHNRAYRYMVPAAVYDIIEELGLYR